MPGRDPARGRRVKRDNDLANEPSSEVKEMQAHAADAASLMRAFGNESRLMILCTLAEGERSVGELNEIIPLSQSALSQQLARLRRDGEGRLVAARIELYAAGIDIQQSEFAFFALWSVGRGNPQ